MKIRAPYWMKVYIINKILKEEPEIEWLLNFDSDILYNKKSNK
jgi:hypothetical protein